MPLYIYKGENEKTVPSGRKNHPTKTGAKQDAQKNCKEGEVVIIQTLVYYDPSEIVKSFSNELFENIEKTITDEAESYKGIKWNNINFTDKKETIVNMILDMYSDIKVLVVTDEEEYEVSNY